MLHNELQSQYRSFVLEPVDEEKLYTKVQACFRIFDDMCSPAPELDSMVEFILHQLLQIVLECADVESILKKYTEVCISLKEFALLSLPHDSDSKSDDLTKMIRTRIDSLQKLLNKWW
jgi:hypothetical protein